MNYNVFKDWTFCPYYAKHKYGYSLWIANGFYGFSDCDLSGLRPKPFLAGLSWWTQWRLWCALRAEQRRRSLLNIASLNDGAACQ